MSKSQPSEDWNERFSLAPWPWAQLYLESRAGGWPARDREPHSHLPPWGGKSYTVSPSLGVRAPSAGKRPPGWQAHHPAAWGIRGQLWGQLGKQPTCPETSPSGDWKVDAVQSPALLLEETVLFAQFALKWPRERQLVWYIVAAKRQHKEHAGAWTPGLQCPQHKEHAGAWAPGLQCPQPHRFQKASSSTVTSAPQLRGERRHFLFRSQEAPEAGRPSTASL